MLPAKHAGFKVLIHKGSMEEHKPFHQPVSFRDTYEVDEAALLTEGGVAKVTQGTPYKFPCCPHLLCDHTWKPEQSSGMLYQVVVCLSILDAFLPFIVVFFNHA